MDTSESKGRSLGCLSIIPILIVCAFAKVLVKSCSKDLTYGKVNSPTSSLTIFSEDNLVPCDVAGIFIKLPSKPVKGESIINRNAQEFLISDTYTFKSGPCMIGISKTDYRSSVNLRGAVEGVQKGVKDQPRAENFKSSTEYLMVDGVYGVVIEMVFDRSGHHITQDSLVFSKDRSLWIVQMVSEGEFEVRMKLKTAIFSSIRFFPAR